MAVIGGAFAFRLYLILGFVSILKEIHKEPEKKNEKW